MSEKLPTKHLPLKSFEIFSTRLVKVENIAELDEATIDDLREKFKDRADKAIKLVKEKGVKKYLFVPSNITRWVVKGHEKEYLVIEKYFCSCRDFLFNVLYRREIPTCYHLLARELAEQLNAYEEIVLKDTEYLEYLNNWL